MARGQAEHLMGMLEDMLSNAGIGWRDLDLIGVGTGPGNFTGIRISVAAARGLAMSLNIPAIGVSTFEAAGFSGKHPFWVSISAPRDQVYLQRFGNEVCAPELAPATRLAKLDAPLIEAGNIEPSERVTNIARLALARKGEKPRRPAPLYVRAADAAPPRDPAPVLLP